MKHLFLVRSTIALTAAGLLAACGGNFEPKVSELPIVADDPGMGSSADTRGLIFYDDFETGNKLKTNSYSFKWSANSNPAIVQSDGNYVARYRYNAGAEWTEQRFSLGTFAAKEIWMSFWLKVPDNYYHHYPTTSSNQKLFFLWMDDYSNKGDGSSVGMEFRPKGERDGSSYFYLKASKGRKTSAGGDFLKHDFIKVPDDRGRWMQLVVRVKAESVQDAKDGEIDVWRRWEGEDYKKTQEARGQAIRVPANGPKGFNKGYLMGWANSPYQVQTDFLIDEFKISTTSLLEEPQRKPEVQTNFVHNLSFDNQAVGEPCKPFGATKMVVADFDGRRVCANTIQGGKTGYGTWGGILNFPKIYEGGEVWVRVRTFFPHGFDPYSYGEGNRLKFLRVRTYEGSGKHIGYNDWLFNSKSATIPHGFIYEGENKWQMFGTRPDDSVTLGRWVTYEMYLKLHHLTGSEGGQSMVRIWRDGKLILETSERRTLKFSHAYANSFYLFTYWNGGSPKTQTMYVDDVAVSTERPGARDAHGNPFIGLN